ncbi:MAG TPA: GNAT family N-acetyltransferase [Actinomycetota bacterium]|nr:GNAT family N-acetyltransferase [Actinomycetota bacterium]
MIRVRSLGIRNGTAGDLAAVNEIYNHYVLTSHCTFDVEPVGIDTRHEWFGTFEVRGRYRFLVAESGGRVVGWATSSPYRPRRAYETSVETTVYVAQQATRGGIATSLYSALMDLVAGEDVHRAYGVIALPNEPSVRLHERLGFRLSGLFSEQGRKFGRWWDVAWYEKKFDD